MKSTIKVKQRQGKKEPQVLEGGAGGDGDGDEKEDSGLFIGFSWDNNFFYNWDNIGEITAISWHQNC
ncbi:MAG: hypothetical protein GX421_02930 [Caldisericales bacterium]|nr:hypothetical protein [Caldisericales bacterium]